MKFGITFIAAIALVFACLVSATRDYNNLKKAITDKKDCEITDAIKALGHTVLTLESVKAANEAQPSYLDALLEFDKEWAEAEAALEKFNSDKTTDNKNKYEKELKEAQKALEKLPESARKFDDKMAELKIKESKHETSWYKNPIYIGVAVVVIIIVLVCIWALFFRKKAEDL